MKTNFDIVIASIPKLSLTAPSNGLAYIKSVVNKKGFNCKLVDWNLDLYQKIDQNRYKNLWDLNDLSFKYKNLFDEFWEDKLESISNGWLEEARLLNPRWLGLSLFSIHNLYLAKKLLKIFRKEIPQVRLLVGGPVAAKAGRIFKVPSG